MDYERRAALSSHAGQICGQGYLGKGTFAELNLHKKKGSPEAARKHYQRAFDQGRVQAGSELLSDYLTGTIPQDNPNDWLELATRLSAAGDARVANLVVAWSEGLQRQPRSHKFTIEISRQQSIEILKHGLLGTQIAFADANMKILRNHFNVPNNDIITFLQNKMIHHNEQAVRERAARILQPLLNAANAAVSAQEQTPEPTVPVVSLAM